MMFRFPTRLLHMAALVPLIAGCALDTSAVDLRTLERPSSPNDALACPAGVCRAAADFESPAFPVPAKVLMGAVREVLEAQPRTELVGRDAALDQLIFVQRSQLFGFPDTIRVQGAAVPAGASVIIHSRSNTGYWDFGVNRDRVRALLEQLNRTLARMGREHVGWAPSLTTNSRP